MRLPSASLPVVAWKPRSPTQCCAHACGQPSRCSRSSAISSPNVVSRWSTRSRSRSFVSPTEKLQCGSPVHAIEFAQISFVESGRPSSSSCASVASTSVTPVTIRFCCRVRRMSPPKESTRSATAISWSPDREPERDGHSDVGAPVLLLGVHTNVRGGLRSDRRQTEPLERAAELRFDALEHSFHADVVDHELQPRLHARHAVLQILAPDRRDRAENLVRLLLRHEDAEVARDARHRREAAADLHRVALTPVVHRADERDAVDLRRVAAVGAARDRVLVLAREVGPRRIAVELRGRGFDDRGRVEELVRGESRDGAAGDVAHRVAAAAGAREACRLEIGEDVGQRRELEPVQLDALARRQLRVTAAVAVRDLADRAQLRGREDPARDLHAQHERPDLRLVVVERPPLEAHDVLLGHPLVAGRDQGRQLLADAERRLVALDPLDGVPLVDGFPGGCLGHSTEATWHYFT